MHSPIAFAVSLLALTASAAPSPRAPTVQVQFANEVSGANGNARIPLNGVPVSLGTAYAKTNLEKGGTLFVTALQFTADFQNVNCQVLKGGSILVASLSNPSRDYDKFSATPVDWQKGFTISCTKH